MRTNRDKQLTDSDDKYRRSFHGIDPSEPAPHFERRWDDHDIEDADSDDLTDDDFDDDSDEFDEDFDDLDDDE